MSGGAGRGCRDRAMGCRTAARIFRRRMVFLLRNHPTERANSCSALPTPPGAAWPDLLAIPPVPFRVELGDAGGVNSTSQSTYLLSAPRRAWFLSVHGAERAKNVLIDGRISFVYLQARNRIFGIITRNYNALSVRP